MDDKNSSTPGATEATAPYMRQPYEFFLNRQSGEMGTRILAETGLVVNQFLKPAAELVAAVLSTAAIVGLLLWVEPVVAFVAFAVLGGIYGGIFALSRRALNQLGRAWASSQCKRVLQINFVSSLV